MLHTGGYGMTNGCRVSDWVKGRLRGSVCCVRDYWRGHLWE